MRTDAVWQIIDCMLGRKPVPLLPVSIFKKLTKRQQRRLRGKMKNEKRRISA
jgi:hypothetical protein